MDDDNEVAKDEREEELGALNAIFPELVLLDPLHSQHSFSASLELPVVPTAPLLVRFISSSPTPPPPSTSVAPTNTSSSHRHVTLSHLPPLTLHITLPTAYPAHAPPHVQLSAQSQWLPKDKITELETEAGRLWEEYGRCQVLYSYIDHLQQAAERAFDLGESAEGALVLSESAEENLVAFDSRMQRAAFEAGTYDCGVCLEPKKGTACYNMSRCGHVFCKECLQAFYENAIKEGDVAGVRCLDPSCGKDKKRKRKGERSIHPRELLAMGIEESMARRYVEMKRKKNLEADKTTVYCPRTWCQNPAKSERYPPIPADLALHIFNEPSSDDDDSDAEDVSNLVSTATLTQTNASKKTDGKSVAPDPTERLAVCEKCSLAFCKVCYMGWHGPFTRCYPRDPEELSAEEKASLDYIRLHTSPCPYCNAPVQKTYGCNHMNCFQCQTHFCYLCGAWIDSNNPYQHFNKEGTPCYQRLWELQSGDDGQGPEGRRGFAGGRGWEQLAFEAARDAEEQEAQLAAVQAPH